MFSKAILSTEYLPPISSFWAILNSGSTYIEHCENYQKKSTRNRAKILGVNGIDVLSIPLKKGKNNNMPIKEVLISYEDSWTNKHLNAIRSAYGNAPYFEFYIDELKRILLTKYETLLGLNTELLKFFIDSINIETTLLPTESYLHNYSKEILDLRSLKFNQSNIPFYQPKKYNQVFEEKHGFISGISLLDLLMCKGPESILYI